MSTDELDPISQIESLKERYRKSRTENGPHIKYSSNGKEYTIKIYENTLPYKVQVFYNDKPYGEPIAANANDYLNFSLGENNEFSVNSNCEVSHNVKLQGVLS